MMMMMMMTAMMIFLAGLVHCSLLRRENKVNFLRPVAMTTIATAAATAAAAATEAIKRGN